MAAAAAASSGGLVPAGEVIPGLPNDIYFGVVSFLSHKEVLTVVPRVSKTWRDLTESIRAIAAIEKRIEADYPHWMRQIFNRRNISIGSFPELPHNIDGYIPEKSPIMRWLSNREAGIILFLRAKEADRRSPNCQVSVSIGLGCGVNHNHNPNREDSGRFDHPSLRSLINFLLTPKVLLEQLLDSTHSEFELIPKRQT